MSIPLYLAMTAAETFADPLPTNLAYMACHFASYGLGISNIPSNLPAGSMLILNDRIPIWEHDPTLVAQQLAEAAAELACASVLLDFQRPGDPKAAAVAEKVLTALPCPVGVSEFYAGDLDCPVFLPPPPPDMSLERHITPWAGREIWLEIAPETIQVTVTREGATAEYFPVQSLSEPCHWDEKCCCHYHSELLEDRAIFTLSRTQEDLTALLNCAEKLGITRAVGLYQQLNNKNPADESLRDLEHETKRDISRNASCSYGQLQTSAYASGWG